MNGDSQVEQDTGMECSKVQRLSVQGGRLTRVRRGAERTGLIRRWFDKCSVGVLPEASSARSASSPSIRHR